MKTSAGLVAFYLLTLWAAIIEISVPLAWYSQGVGWLAIGIGMSIYHLGYIASSFLSRVQIDKYPVITIFLLLIIWLGASLWITEILLHYVCIFFISTFIRLYRASWKQNNYFSKKVNGNVRQLGYILGGVLVNSWAIVAIFGILFVFLLLLSREKYSPVENLIKWELKNIPTELLPLIYFEFFHSLHYFVYCYILLAIFWDHLPGNSKILTGVIFASGWTGYSILYSRLNRFNPKLVFWGHMINSIAIFLMVYNFNIIWLAFLWIVTGFGGGTNFSIRFGTKSIQKSFSDYREWAENFGHVLGPLIGSVAFICISEDGLFIISAFIAMLSAFMMCFIHNLTKEKYSHGSDKNN